MESRTEHLAACKRLARRFIGEGDLFGAWIYFVDAMKQHPETRYHPSLRPGFALMEYLEDGHQMEQFIENFT